MSKDRPLSTGVVSSTQVFAEPQDIDSTVAMTDEQIVESTAFSQPPPLIGAVLNERFHLKEIIDQGGMGQILRAIQEPMGREVAIKIMRAPDDRVAEKRFFREAAITANLEHPNTVRIYDYGSAELDEGQRLVYIAMELLRGNTLREEIRSGPISSLRSISILLQICSALSEAHEKGLIHRDIKPSNIFMLQHESTFAKLLDFGLVKNIQNDSSELTQTGMVMGSPMYMSPEQVQSESVDARSDIYSLGMSLYHMLSGFAPFEGEFTTVMMAQILKMPQEMNVRNSEISIPPILEWTVFQCIQKDPSLRFQSVHQLRQALEICEEQILLNHKKNKEDQTWISLSFEQGVLLRSDGKPLPILHTGSTGAVQNEDYAEMSNTLRRQAERSHPTLIEQKASPPVSSSSRISFIIISILFLLSGVATFWVYSNQDSTETAQEVQQPSVTQYTSTITTTPSGAKILKDGALLGRTPHSFSVPIGEQWALEIQHPGYLPLNLVVSESFKEINEQLTPEQKKTVETSKPQKSKPAAKKKQKTKNSTRKSNATNKNQTKERTEKKSTTPKDLKSPW
ncbi:MAG: hypothetical protein CMK59_10820 [Proteobacteria bacterium]|nr:hypothetical protein [Pseudomonadota bacterium]